MTARDRPPHRGRCLLRDATGVDGAAERCLGGEENASKTTEFGMIAVQPTTAPAWTR